MTRFLNEDAVGVFLLVTVALGGGGAALAGRAVAITWRPVWQTVIYTLMLGAAVRFIHYALFDGTLLSLHYYLVDTVICLMFGAIGFQTARASQMISQYRWLYRPDGPLRWRRRSP
jgi:GR25 family glycosyltransferase involved in LPS biosynthesis